MKVYFDEILIFFYFKDEENKYELLMNKFNFLERIKIIENWLKPTLENRIILISL